jgi:hypothetical protein
MWDIKFDCFTIAKYGNYKIIYHKSLLYFCDSYFVAIFCI